MSNQNSNKTRLIISIIVTVAGCVLACSSIIPNDYAKLLVVMVALGYGLFGIMKGLSHHNADETKEDAAGESSVKK